MIYEYTREKVNGKYNINNPDRLNGVNEPIFLAKEIELQISKKFKIVCENGSCKIIFEEHLTIDEKDILDIIVSNHKQNA